MMVRITKRLGVVLIWIQHLCGFSQGIPKTMLHLPDTGQDSSYTSIFGEDADYQNYKPSFLIDDNGTIADIQTGLVWQQYDSGEMKYEDAINYSDTLTLGGYSDWRLPSAHESFSILNFQFANPALDPQVFGKSVAEYWWTGDKQVNDPNKIWVTNAGGGIGNHLKTETISAGGNKRFHCRAVRDAQTPSVIPERYEDSGDGSVTDLLTGLIWQKTPNMDSLSWEQAIDFAESLSLSGKSDWRLPNIRELQSINDESRINPSLNKTFFAVNTANKYWSSTTLPNLKTRAWYLNTQFGITTYDEKTVRHPVICVRGNQQNTGLKNMHNSSLVKVFPNPFHTFIKLENIPENTVIELSDFTGRIIYSGVEISDHDFSSLPNGIYFLRLSDPLYLTKTIVCFH